MAILSVTSQGHTVRKSSFPGLVLDLLIVLVLLVMIAIATAGAAFYLGGDEYATAASRSGQSGPHPPPSR
jgi:hypothetical protein